METFCLFWLFFLFYFIFSFSGYWDSPSSFLRLIGSDVDAQLYKSNYGTLWVSTCEVRNKRHMCVILQSKKSTVTQFSHLLVRLSINKFQLLDWVIPNRCCPPPMAMLHIRKKERESAIPLLMFVFFFLEIQNREFFLNPSERFLSKKSLEIRGLFKKKNWKSNVFYGGRAKDYLE